MTLYRFILFHESGGLLQAIFHQLFTNFSLYFSNSKPPAGKFPLHQQDLLSEKGRYYPGKLFFQPAEPNASQQQKKKREKGEKKMETIKSSITF